MSLRRTALLWLAGLMTVIGLVAAAASYYLARLEASDFLDDQLRQVALFVANASPTPASSSVDLPFDDPDDEVVIQIRDEAGAPIYPAHPKVDLATRRKTGYARVSASGTTWRVFDLVGNGRIVQVAQRTAVRQELATEASLEAALPIALIIPLSWIVLSWLIGRIMAPVDRLAGAVRARPATTAEALPTDRVPVEMLPFVASINDLLTRLRTAMDQQRRFISDAAHELRTPLAALQIQLDNLRAAPQGVAEPYLADLRAGLLRTTALVSQLLLLARYDSNVFQTATAPVDLTRLVLDCVAQRAPFAHDRGIDLGVVRQDPLIVQGVAADFERIVGNLLDNAIRYTPAPGIVDVSVVGTAAEAVVEIRDSGPGIAVDAMPHAFERFFRAAPGDYEGSGLGLAIAKAAADRNGATITLNNRADRSGLIARLVTERLISS
jgi:two-component system OmpR family sensor kinase/two-component system sensor histidine kinase QseC